MTDTLHVDRGKLEGRVAFVTGGTRGIGAAICRSLASQGAAIAAGYSSNDEAANAFAEDFRAKHLDGGGEITLHKGNIGVGDDCRRAVQEVVDQHGRIDLLVNNAGITIDRTVAKMTDDDWNKVIAVNLSGAFYLSQAVLPHFIAQGTGRIVDGIPMKRLGHPHEIARVVRFLASDESGWITGQVWGVNGGQHM